MVPLYSLHTHFTQLGCSFLGVKESGFPVYFSTFVHLVNTAVGCHLSFNPLGHSAPLDTLHYVQPRCPPSTYPSKVSPALSAATPSPASPAVMEDDDDVAHLCMAMPPIHTSSTPSNDIDMGALSRHLNDLVDTPHWSPAHPKYLINVRLRTQVRLQNYMYLKIISISANRA